MDLITLTTFICLVFLSLAESNAREQISLPYTPTIFLELDNHLTWYLSIETSLRQNSVRILRNVHI